MEVTKEHLLKLKETMPYKWRVQSTKFEKSTIVAYVDSRQVQDKLDDCVGADNWQDDYKVIKDQMFAGIGIKINGEWIWKWDTGTENQMEAEKSIVSDSFKRAAVKWGVGRFLYSLGIVTLKAKKHTTGKEYPSDDKGNILWTAEDLNKYMIENYENGVKKKGHPATQSAKQPTPIQPSKEFDANSLDERKQAALSKFKELKTDWKIISASITMLGMSDDKFKGHKRQFNNLEEFIAESDIAFIGASYQSLVK